MVSLPGNYYSSDSWHECSLNCPTKTMQDNN
jgi:hypothetical protein